MNKGTKIRTALIIATSLNTALMATDLTGFNNPKIDAAYKIASIILNFVIVAASTYFNNDYTIEGEIGTRITRELKAREAEGDLELYDRLRGVMDDN